MLPKYHEGIRGGVLPIIKKYCDGRELSRLGAFPFGKELRIEVTLPRRLGDGGVVLRLFPDGCDHRDLPLSFFNSREGRDVYSVTLTPDVGLYYWELLFLRGFDTLFTSSVNNLDFTLDLESRHRFRMLIYDGKAAAPDWFSGGIMYQIFPDRFARGETVYHREDALIHESFDGEIEQYAPVPGGEVENNEFFGGSLYGVIDKLDYLASLGVTVIYLNPIFEAYSNHRYDTGDYEKVDSLLGGDGALAELIKKAE